MYYEITLAILSLTDTILILTHVQNASERFRPHLLVRIIAHHARVQQAHREGVPMTSRPSQCGENLLHGKLPCKTARL